MITDEHREAIKNRLRDFHYGGGSVQDDIGFLLDEVDFHRERDAELHRLATKARDGNWDPIDLYALADDVLGKCRPS